MTVIDRPAAVSGTSGERCFVSAVQVGVATEVIDEVVAGELGKPQHEVGSTGRDALIEVQTRFGAAVGAGGDGVGGDAERGRDADRVEGAPRVDGPAGVLDAVTNRAGGEPVHRNEYAVVVHFEAACAGQGRDNAWGFGQVGGNDRSLVPESGEPSTLNRRSTPVSSGPAMGIPSPLGLGTVMGRVDEVRDRGHADHGAPSRPREGQGPLRSDARWTHQPVMIVQ